jgi:epoxyqueuosine reductase
MRAFPTQDTLTDAVRSRALGLGFHRVGVAPADPLTDDGARLRSWLDAGHHGDMHWLADTPEARADVTHPRVLPGAKTVIVCALSYHRGDEPSPMPGAVHRPLRPRPRLPQFPPQEAATARGVDARRARRRGAPPGRHGARPRARLGPPRRRRLRRQERLRHRPRPRLLPPPRRGGDRPRARPRRPMESAAGAAPAASTCAPRGPSSPPWCSTRGAACRTSPSSGGPHPRELRAPMGASVFGCDDCQDVCPFNRTAPPPASTTTDFAPDPRWRAHSLARELRGSPCARCAGSAAHPGQR